MRLISTYMVPACWALLFHALVIGLLMTNWEDTSALEVTDVEPYFIEASIVNENPHRAKQQREAAAEANRRRIQREREAAARAEREAAEKAAAEAARKQARIDELKAQQAAEERARQQAAARDAEIAAQQGDDRNDDDLEEARVAMADELARAVMSEQSARQAVTDYEKAMAYAARIRQDIVQQWSRPPSARNGMQALLRVSLVPTGEVVDVVVVEGSGNDAFDRSAILAVEKAERFVVPEDSRQFEQHFRNFEVLFRPEDLRL